MSTCVSSAITRSWMARAFAWSAGSVAPCAPADAIASDARTATRASVTTLPFHMSASLVTVNGFCSPYARPASRAGRTTAWRRRLGQRGRLTTARGVHGVRHRGTPRAVLGAVPPMAVVIDLMDLSSFAISHAKERGHPRVGSDHDARVERVHVARLGKDLELYGFL